ncbi:MAG: secretion system protein E, partial [Halobacteriaceae archaeon]
MATDQADSGGDGGPSAEERVAVGAYTWTEFMREHGHGNEADAVYPDDGGGRFGRGGDDSGPEFDGVSFDPEQYLGFDPAETGDRIGDAAGLGKGLREAFETYLEETPVAKDEYLWEHFKWEHYYDAEGNRPRDGDGEVVPFDESEHLGFDADDTEGVLAHVGGIGEEMAELVDRRTVNVNDELDEDEFFSDIEGHTTLVNRYDLEKEVPLEKKLHFREIDRYWANKPYSYVVIFHSDRENEKKYYVIEPYRNSIEMELQSFLTEKLRAAIKYASDDVVVEGGEGERRDVIERETRKLLERYELFDGEPADLSLTDKLMAMLGRGEVGEQEGGLDGIEVRPEPVVIEEDDDQLSQYQVEKLLYYLKRNFIGYER